MVDFTESMLGIDSPSVGVGTVPSAGLTTMLNVVFGARGLSAQALPEEETRPAARASADAPAMVLTSRTERIVASTSERLRVGASQPRRTAESRLRTDSVCLGSVTTACWARHA